MASDTTEAKRATFTKMHEDGMCVVHLNPRCPGARVPAPWADTTHLNLRFGTRLNPPVRTLEIDADGVRALLSFGGAAHYVIVPWAAVFGMTFERKFGEALDTRVWPASVPEEVYRRVGFVSAGGPRMRLLPGGAA